MEKTKLGLSTGLVIALAFFLCLFGNYVPAVLIAGYVLLCEENLNVKKGALKALLLMIVFDLLFFAINLIPSILTLPRDFMSNFGLGFIFNAVDGFFGAISTLVSLAEKVLFIVYALLSLKKGAAPKLPLIDKMVNKAID